MAVIIGSQCVSLAFKKWQNVFSTVVQTWRSTNCTFGPVGVYASSSIVCTGHQLQICPQSDQGLYISWKVMELKSHIFQVWKVLESGLGPWESWKCKVTNFAMISLN